MPLIDFFRTVPEAERFWSTLHSAWANEIMALLNESILPPGFEDPATPAPEQQTASVFSADSVIMDQGSEEQMSYEQVLSTIYDEDEAR